MNLQRTDARGQIDDTPQVVWPSRVASGLEDFQETLDQKTKGQVQFHRSDFQEKIGVPLPAEFPLGENPFDVARWITAL
jgi:hypothetical protein